MKPEIRLRDPSQWVQKNNLLVRGSAFETGSTELLMATDIVDLLRNSGSTNEIKNLVGNLTGHFALISHLDDKTVVAVDQVRSVPLFYRDDATEIGDTPRELVDDIDAIDLDTDAESEYLVTRYVSGNETLLPSIKQMEAGELLVIDHDLNSISSHQHTQHYPTSNHGKVADLRKAVETAVERLCSFADGRPIYLLLSGGVDSRLILSELLLREYDPLTALTFGRPNHDDVIKSKRIADAAGLDREYVEYDEEIWWDWFHSDERETYYELAHNFDSLPGLQAGPALSILESRDRLPDEAVFVTGQTIGSIGEHLPPQSVRTRDDLLEHILTHHYERWRYDDEMKEMFRDRIDSTLKPADSSIDVYSAYENWEWKERQSKFMSQDGFMYERLGYNWWFPLLDKAVIDAWGSLPVDDRRNKSAFVTIMNQKFSSVADNDILEEVDAESIMSFERLRELLLGTLFEHVARYAYESFSEVSGPRPHPLAMYGIMDQSQPGEFYTGRESIQSYRLMHATGRMRFKPVDNSRLPNNCIITRDYIEST